MTEEIIISGFGGQGVLSMGKILAYAGIMEGKQVVIEFVSLDRHTQQSMIRLPGQ